MKAIIIDKPGVIKLKELPKYPLKRYEVCVKVKCTCICGSDLKNISNPIIEQQIPGHEFSGFIEETSKEVNGFEIGDRVTAFPMISCLNCIECLEKNYRDCEHKKTIGTHIPGSFSEYVNLDSRFLIKLNDSISYKDGALVEHLACGYRLVREIIGHKFCKNVHILIIGDGPIALADLQMLLCFGFTKITMIGKHVFRKDMCKSIGANQVFDLNDIKRIDSPIGICIFAAKADETLLKVLEYIRPYGIIYPQVRITDQLLLKKIKKRELKFDRAFAYHISDFYKVIDLIINGDIQTKPLVTSEIDLFDVKKIVASLSNKHNQIKIMLHN
jgi:threonine dehydrogenase-like Zn-dependent dehydrogenase